MVYRQTIEIQKGILQKVDGYKKGVGDLRSSRHQRRVVYSARLFYINLMSLYQDYLNSKTGDTETKVSVINEIISTYPKIIDYLYNRIDTCFGEHTVYLVHMRVGGEDMLKVGYTKNDVRGRFSENRYSGRDTIEIVSIIRENKLQAKGAVDFEHQIKELTKDYKIKTNLTLPGKNEFMSIEHMDEVINLYDRLYGEYKDVEGLKSPN